MPTIHAWCLPTFWCKSICLIIKRKNPSWLFWDIITFILGRRLSATQMANDKGHEPPGHPPHGKWQSISTVSVYDKTDTGRQKNWGTCYIIDVQSPGSCRRYTVKAVWNYSWAPTHDMNPIDSFCIDSWHLHLEDLPYFDHSTILWSTMKMTFSSEAVYYLVYSSPVINVREIQGVSK